MGGDEITHTFPNYNSAAIEVWEWISIFTHILLGMILLMHAEIKVKSC